MPMCTYLFALQGCDPRLDGPAPGGVEQSCSVLRVGGRVDGTHQHTTTARHMPCKNNILHSFLTSTHGSGSSSSHVVHSEPSALSLFNSSLFPLSRLQFWIVSAAACCSSLGSPALRATPSPTLPGTSPSTATSRVAAPTTGLSDARTAGIFLSLSSLGLPRTPNTVLAPDSPHRRCPNDSHYCCNAILVRS